MKRYVRSSEMTDAQRRDYVNKVKRIIQIELGDYINDIQYDMKDDKIYVTITYKSGDIGEFNFDSWRFTMLPFYVSEDADIIINEIEESLRYRGDIEESEWVQIDHKMVEDYDGFMTDYTLYTNGDTFVCIFGDNELYTPENTEPDFECDTESEAHEWFDNYDGFADYDEIDSSTCVKANNYNFSAFTKETSTPMSATDVVRWMYDEFPDWEFYDEHELRDGRIMLKFEIGPKYQREDLEDALKSVGLQGVFRNQLTIIAPEDVEYSVDDIKSSVKFFDKGEGGKYWYFTTHGVQPGSVPRGLTILEIIDKPEGSYFLTDKVLTTESLKYYDIKERFPRR